jgi:phosphatidylserine/phosphatidylglycerophosphate/cardiolipin synthase-like enzyme
MDNSVIGCWRVLDYIPVMKCLPTLLHGDTTTEMTSIYLLNYHRNMEASTLKRSNETSDQSLTLLSSGKLDEETRTWDNDGAPQSLYQELIEMKRRKKIERWERRRLCDPLSSWKRILIQPTRTAPL